MRRTLLSVSTVPVAALLLAPVAMAQAGAGRSAGLAAVQVSADPYLNRAAEHATEVEPDTIAVGHSVMSVFQVGRWDNGCSDDTGWALSTNGGRDWRHGFLPGLTKSSHPAGPFDRVSDPAVAYNARFGIWLVVSLDCNGTSPRPSAPVFTPALSVSLSADGVHWTKPFTAARAKKRQAFDKEWITCDNSPASRFFGNCYIEWDLPSQNDLVVMATSHNGGQSWSAPVTTASHLHGIAGEPVVQPNGTVVVPIIGFVGQNAPMVAFRSTNGGRTWGRTIRMTGIFQHPPGGNLRGPFLPSAAVDQAGTVYVTWPDCRFRPNCASNDMVMTTSTDGIHWRPVVRIPIDPISSTVDHLGGGLGVDPTTAGGHARLGLFYNFYPDAACTVSSCRLFEGFISSTDGGAHWSAPRVAGGPMRLRQLAFASGFTTGDYEGTAVIPGGNAVSAFPVGGIPSGTQRLSEAMFEPSGGAPVTGGAIPAISAGARHATPARMPHIVH